MQVIRHTDSDFQNAIRRLNRNAEPSADVEKSVREIIAKVRAGGDDALVELGVKFGGPKLAVTQLRVSAAELRDAKKRVDAATKKAIAASHANVRDFAKRGSIRFSASAFTCPAAPRHSFRQRS